VLVLNPEKVSFAGQVWEAVESIAIDRLVHRLVQEWSDLGPHVVFCDVPEQRVRLVLVQKLDEGSIESPKPGDAGTLSFEAARSGSDAGRVVVSGDMVVGEVRHEVTRKGGVRSVVMWAVSSDGASDPISVGGAT